MTRNKRRKPKQVIPASAAPLSPPGAPAARPPVPPAQEPAPGKYAWIPLWGWALIFALPLIASEFMFYAAGRWGSMILFPLAWIGFWATMMWRSGWAIFRRHR